MINTVWKDAYGVQWKVISETLIHVKLVSGNSSLRVKKTTLLSGKKYFRLC